ncbi:glycosyltransferase family 4 protein [Candidatus Margulisiibacteriota bacterium]
MRIGIDISLATKDKAGIGSYADNLAGALAELDKANQYFLYSHSASHLNRHLWFQSLLPLSLQKDEIDVFHGTNFMSPFLSSVSSVITIHDLSFLLYPESQPLIRRLYRKLLPLSVKGARKIIVPSQIVKDEVIKYYGVAGSKIAVTPEGVSSEFKVVGDKDKLSSVRQRYGLPEKFILYVGTLEPRKNVAKLIEAFRMLKDKEPGIKLVIVGKKGWLFQKMAEQDVIFTGYVPAKDLPAVYNLAEVFVFPSLYEGFGLPVLEAMACGVPVVTSNVSSLPEVAGEAALLANPNSAEAIAEQVLKLLKDPSLRESMINKGLARAKLFTWEKCARETLKVYQEAAHA